MHRFRNTTLILLLSGLLSACASHEARELVPTLTLSPENVLLAENSGAPQTPGIDFGLTVTVNESDSLTNITVLPGVRVRAAASGGPAALAGIRAGDVILSVNGLETNHPDQLDALAVQSEDTQTFDFEVRRNTTVFNATVNARAVTGQQLAPVELYRADPIATRAGFSTEILQDAGQNPVSGARIVRFFDKSPLAARGFAVDDVIFSVNDQSVDSAQGFVNLIHNQYELGDTLTVGFARDNQVRYENLRLWHPGRRLSRLSLWPLVTYESTLSPDRTRLTIGDFWLFSLFSYQREQNEKEYSLFSVFRTATGYGELVEE